VALRWGCARKVATDSRGRRGGAECQSAIDLRYQARVRQLGTIRRAGHFGTFLQFSGRSRRVHPEILKKKNQLEARDQDVLSSVAARAGEGTMAIQGQFIPNHVRAFNTFRREQLEIAPTKNLRYQVVRTYS
jgi:hypothetical protein